jgi:hypothetical protein
MPIQDIKSEKVRAILSGDPSPARTLRDMAPDLTVAEFQEACAYFGGYSKLIEHAIAEFNFCQYWDI